MLRNQQEHKGINELKEEKSLKLKPLFLQGSTLSTSGKPNDGSGHISFE